MYNEQMTQAIAIAGTPVHAQQLTSTTTTNTGKVDLSLFKKVMFVVDIGALGGTSPTVSAVTTIQESPDGTTWTANAIVSTMTLSNGSNVGTTEIRADQLGAGKRYVRAQTVFTIGGTSPTVPVVVIPLCGEAIHKPGNVNNDASVVTQAVTN